MEQLLTGQDHIYHMHDSLSKTHCFQFNFHWGSSRKKIGENSCYESYYKTREEINEGFTY